MADQEIDRLLLEIEVEDKTQGGSKKLVDEFATAISKLQAEINKLDTSKLEAVSKALSFSGVGGGGAKGTSAIGKQSAELKQARKELAALTKAYDEYAQAGVRGDALSIIREGLGIDEAQKRVDELSAQGGIGSVIEDVEQTTKDWSEEVGDLGMMTIHDEIVIKGRKKDTIVLRGGENVEPVPIELKLAESCCLCFRSCSSSHL